MTTFSMTPSPIEEEDPLPTFTGLDRERVAALARDRAERAEAHLAPAIAVLEGRGFVAGSTVSFMAALAGSELVRVAEQRSADLIVVGLVKRSRVGKALLGGDAQSVLLGASCPVLCSRLSD
jgi:nucleotide-binding universal stress UspA family protein